MTRNNLLTQDGLYLQLHCGELLEKVRIPKSITYTVAIAVGVNRETKFRYFVLIPEK